jgi:hypothetical protein
VTIRASFAPLACLVALAMLLGVAPAARATHRAVSTYGEGTAAAPFSLVPPVDQAFSLGPPADQSISLAIPVQGELPFTAVATSRPLDMGKPTQDKEFLSLTWLATKPRGTVLFVSYSVDGGAWLPAVGGVGYDIPEGTHGRTIAYRITLTTGDSSQTPVVEELAIEWTRWTGRPTDPPPGGGGGTSHQPGADHKPGSGSYTYPDSGGGSSSSAGGTGSGGSGAGAGGGYSGGGSGGGSETGGGSGGSGAGVVDSTTSDVPPQTTTAPGVTVPSPPVLSAPVGAPATVNGLPVSGEVAITGVPLEPSGGASAMGGERGRTPAAAAGHRDFPVLPVTGVVSSLVVAIFVPWMLMAARLRRITGADLENARLLGPFWPLGH